MMFTVKVPPITRGALRRTLFIPSTELFGLTGKNAGWREVCVQPGRFRRLVWNA